jgi:hypothetical protein
MRAIYKAEADTARPFGNVTHRPIHQLLFVDLGFYDFS